MGPIVKTYLECVRSHSENIIAVFIAVINTYGVYNYINSIHVFILRYKSVGLILSDLELSLPLQTISFQSNDFSNKTTSPVLR